MQLNETTKKQANNLGKLPSQLKRGRNCKDFENIPFPCSVYL